MYKHCKQDIKVIFAMRLKSNRNFNLLTQNETAKQLHLSLRVYQNYESDKSPNMPTFSTLIDISNLFQISTDYLLGQTDNPQINI